MKLVNAKQFLVGYGTEQQPGDWTWHGSYVVNRRLEQVASLTHIDKKLDLRLPDSEVRYKLDRYGSDVEQHHGIEWVVLLCPAMTLVGASVI